MTLFDAIAAVWIVSSLLLIGCVLAARRRRGLLARELHELRGAITAAQLAVELSPQDGPGGGESACIELSRTRETLADFEHLLHRRLLRSRPPARDEELQQSVPKRREIIAESFDAAAELERLVEIWGGAAGRLGREFAFAAAQQPGTLQIAGRRRHFTQAVANLLANALRHGAGRIEISARVEHGRLSVEVCDQGRGLSRPVDTGRRIAARSSRHGHGLQVAIDSAHKLGGSLRSAPSSAGARMILQLPILEPCPQVDRLLGIRWAAAQ